MSDPDGPPPYEVIGRAKLEAWKQHETDEALVAAVEFWISGLYWYPDQHPSVVWSPGPDEVRTAVVPDTGIGVAYVWWRAARLVRLLYVGPADQMNDALIG